MLGSNKGCGGPVSWWCREAWRCSPRVSPNWTTASANNSEMADCDQCSAKFTLLKRKKVCNGCGLLYCGSCISRGLGGTRSCNKCIVLSQWPLDSSRVAALRVKDLRHFLHSKHINTVACTEKQELIDLVTRHICSQHRGSDNLNCRSTAPNNANNCTSPERPHFKLPTSTVRDDGIRVRPSSTTADDLSNLGSIRVRPVDSIRVRPGRPISPDCSDYDPEADLGIRVFASENAVSQHPRASSISPVSVEGCSESAEEECSRCPSEDCTTSCCSLDSCHNGASSQLPTCPHRTDNSGHCSLEDVSASSEGQVGSSSSPVLPNGSLNTVAQAPSDSLQNERPQDSELFSSHQQSNSGSESSEVPTENAARSESEPSAPPLEEESQPLAAASPSSASSSPFPSEASSPEPTKQFGTGIVALEDLKSEEDIQRLSIRQCKEVLALHRVNLSGVREKSELIHKVTILWKDFKNTQQDVEGLPDELICKICMDSVIDCVFLECGHMVACTQCGKQMSECPVCRQYVVRVVRTFRA